MEPEDIKTCVMDLTADGFAILSSDDGSTHTLMRWEMTPKGMSLEPQRSYSDLGSAWVGLYALREDQDATVVTSSDRLLD